MKLDRFGLNLLIPFNVLIQEKHVSRAAQKLHISQSAASKLLNQLRELHQDPLLVRTANGMEATEYALTFQKEVAPLLKKMELLFISKKEFDPKNFEKVIRIGIPHTISDSILPKIYEKLSAQAPGMRLNVLNIDAQTLQQKMSNDEIDMAITYGSELPEVCKATLLYMDHPVCLARRNHPLMKQRSIKIKDYLKCKHVALVYHEFSKDLLGDRLLKKHGFETRDVKLILRSPLAALSIISESDMLLSITQSFAEMYSKQFDLEYRHFSMPLAGMPVHLVWSPIYDTSPWHKWTRDLVKTLFRQNGKLIV